MRQDSAAFTVLNLASSKEPRFVIAIEFDVESIYLTSHAGITDVPGVVIENVLRDPSAISQKIVPDEGRSEIGSFSFSLVDLASAFTNEVRDKLLNDLKGLRGKTVRYYYGYTNPGIVDFGGFGSGGFGEGGFGEGILTALPDCSFNDLQLFQTQVIRSVEYEDGVYSVSCSDITREQRKTIFEPKFTTLRDNIDDAVGTIPVYSTTGFQMVYHGASYSDAPTSYVGYVKLDKEIIRFTSITADGFVGCTRGVLNTRAVAHSVDANTVADRRPKVTEVVYLELPVAMLAYAILTGAIYGQPSYNLPPHWCLGIDTDLVRLSDFTAIGLDLWNTADDTAGFIAKFVDPGKTDGKRFLESEVYLLMGCYSPIYSDGTIGLKRMNQVVQDASAVVELNETNVVSAGQLLHDYDSLHNIIRIDWNWNGTDYTRTTIVADSQSEATHGSAPVLQLKFKGLQGSRHTDAVIKQRISALRDRYTDPPENLDVTVLPSLNRLEVGDIVRVALPNVRDFAGVSSAIDRAFEIQNKSQNDGKGDVTLQLFGSTGLPSITAPQADNCQLPDSYYSAVGTLLSSVVTISVVGGVGHVTGGPYTLTGNDDVNNAASVFYYVGDLQIDSGVTIRINKNFQLRVKGFFQNNGTIDGIGRGHTGVSDTAGVNDTVLGTPGFVGNSRGMDGVSYLPQGQHGALAGTRTARLTQALHGAFPYLNLDVDVATLSGLPQDLQGTGGGPGEKFTLGSVTNLGNGGTGGAGGSGLAIICRGMAFGVAGLVNLSGNSSASTSLVTTPLTGGVYPGPGGAGGPGSMLILLDGSSISVPDITAKFIAITGHVPIDGHPLLSREYHRVSQLTGEFPPLNGFTDEALISDADYSNACNRIQYVPCDEAAVDDADLLPETPLDFSVTPIVLGNLALWTPPILDYDAVEIYASITNHRPDSLLVGEVKGSSFLHSVPGSATRYYWIRARSLNAFGQRVYSAFTPDDEDAGIAADRMAGIFDDIVSGFTAGPVTLSGV